MKIEWASDFAPDGSRRTPPPSTIHGWLAKWRGTLSGNEHLRSRGMAEMRKAAAYRRARRRYEHKKAEKRGKSGSGFFSFFSRSKPSRQASRLSSRSRQHSTHRPKGIQSSRRLTTRQPGSKPTSSHKRAPPRARPKAKPHHSSTRRPHGRA